jgi:hypothetical protein
MNGAFTSWSLNSKVNFWLCFRIHFLRTFETVIHAECCHCIVSHRLLQCYQPRVLVFSRYILLSYFLTYIAVSFKLFLITFYFHSWVKTWPKIQLLSIFELVYILLYQNVWDNLGRRFRGTKSGDSGGGLQYRKGLETLFYFTASSCFSKYHSFKSHCWSQTILKLPTDFVYPPPPSGQFLWITCQYFPGVFMVLQSITGIFVSDEGSGICHTDGWVGPRLRLDAGGE